MYGNDSEESVSEYRSHVIGQLKNYLMSSNTLIKMCLDYHNSRGNSKVAVIPVSHSPVFMHSVCLTCGCEYDKDFPKRNPSVSESNLLKSMDVSVFFEGDNHLEI